MDTLKLVLTNSKFWTVMVVLVHELLFYFVPTFPDNIWNAGVAVFGVVISILFVDEVRKARAARLDQPNP